MATIQVRDIPEADYEVLRRRARAAGQSIQAYMRDRVRELAQRPSPDELRAAITAFHDAHPRLEPFDPVEIVTGIDADRR